MMQMSHQNQHLHTGQVPTASQQPHYHPSAASHLHGQQINAQQQHTMSHHQQHQVMTSQQQQQQQQQQSHINMTSQQFGLSASHNANVVHQSMDNLPMAQQPHYMNQQINHSQFQQLQRQQYHQQQQQQQQQHQFLQHQQQPYRQGQLQQVQVAGVPDKEAEQIKPQAKHEPVDTNPMLCVRRGCTKLAIISDEWEDEYCSNECAVSHCREVFNSFHKGDP